MSKQKEKHQYVYIALVIVGGFLYIPFAALIDSVFVPQGSDVVAHIASSYISTVLLLPGVLTVIAYLAGLRSKQLQHVFLVSMTVFLILTTFMISIA